MIISRESLMSLETYAKTRVEFRKQVMEHKKKTVAYFWATMSRYCLKMK